MNSVDRVVTTREREGDSFIDIGKSRYFARQEACYMLGCEYGFFGTIQMGRGAESRGDLSYSRGMRGYAGCLDVIHDVLDFWRSLVLLVGVTAMPRVDGHCYEKQNTKGAKAAIEDRQGPRWYEECDVKSTSESVGA